MGRPIQADSTDQSTTIRIIDSSDGTPEQAVEHNSAGIAFWYRRGATGAKTAITMAALAALTTAHTDGGIEHIDDGYYRLDLPDAAVATGVDYIEVGGAVTDMIVLGAVHQIVDYDPSAAKAGFTDAVLDEALSGHTTAGTLGKAIADIETDTNELQTDDVPGLIAALNDPTAATIADAVLDELLSGHTTAGSLGKAIADIETDTNELQTDDVPGLIAALNDPTAAAIADAVWDEALSGHVTAGSAGKALADIETDTNELQTDDVPGLIAALNDPTAAAIADAVWDEAQSGHVTAGTFGYYLDAQVSAAATPPTASAIADAVWDEVQSGHTTAGTFGYYLDAQVSAAAAPPSAASIADAVWDEVRADHTTVGTFGEHTGDAAYSTPPTAGAIADAVWDEPTSGHTTGGTFGEQLKTDVDNILSDITTLHDTRIPDTISLANIRTQADNALSAVYLDQLIANTYDSAAPSGAADSLLNEMTENNAGNTRFTAAALAQATGGVGTIAAIADGVWDELTAGHVTAGSFGEVLQYILSAENIGAAVWDDVRSGHTTSGSFGEALTSTEAQRDAAIADAVWDEATSGHTGAGTFGEQAKTDIDAILTSVGNVLGTTTLYSGTIASLASQTVMTLAATYPPDADSLNGHMAVFQDQSTTAQVDAVRITDYSSSGEITLEREPKFTIATGDSITVLVTNPGISDTRLDAALVSNIETYGLDHLFQTSITGTDVADNSFAAQLVSKSVTADFDDYVNTSDSLQALADTSYDGALLSTTVAGVTDQSNFTLTDGPTDADALNGAIAVITDAVTSTQFTIREITDYTAGRVMTLDSDASFTVATTDVVKIYPSRHIITAAAIRSEIDSNSTQLASLISSASTQDSGDTARDAQIALVKTETDKIATLLTDHNAIDAVLALIQTETDKIPATITKIDSIKSTVENLSGLELVDTTVATVDSTTQFRLTAGPPDDDALNGALAVFTDAATATQKSFRNITDYVASTKQITVASAPDFVIATTDIVQVFAEKSVTDYTSTLSTIQTETDKIAGMITTQGSHTSSLSTIDGYTSPIAANQTALLARHTTNDATAALIKAKTDLIGTASGQDDTAILAAVAVVDANVDTINSTTAGFSANINRIDEIETKIDTIDGIVDAIVLDTAGIASIATNVTNIDTNVTSMSTSGVALTTAAQSALVAAISGAAIGGNNITVSIANYGQVVANTLTLKEGQEEQVTFTSTVADIVPDLSVANTQLLFGVKTADKTYALRCLDGAFLVNTGLQSVRVDISETLARNLVPGRGEFDLWILYGYDAADGSYTDARLFASGQTKIDASNVQLTI